MLSVRNWDLAIINVALTMKNWKSTFEQWDQNPFVVSMMLIAVPCDIHQSLLIGSSHRVLSAKFQPRPIRFGK